MVPSELLGVTNDKVSYKTETEVTTLKIYYCVAGVIAFFSNLFLIISVASIRQIRQIPIYVFLINMEISDFLKSFALFGWLYNVSTAPYSSNPPMGVTLCNILGCLAVTTAFNNCCVTSFILLDRLYLLAYPLRYDSTITCRFYCKVNISNWLAWIAFGFLPLVQEENMTYDRFTSTCEFALGKNPTERSIIWHMFVITLLVIIPTLSVFVVYCILRPYYMKRSTSLSGRLPIGQKMRYHIIVWSHVLLTWPLTFMLVIDQINAPKTHHPTFPPILWVLCGLLMSATCITNPMVLGFSDQAIKKTITKFTRIIYLWIMDRF